MDSIKQDVDFVIGDVKVTISKCNFNGLNTDGSSPFQFKVRADGVNELVEINLSGWNCIGPVQGEREKESIPDIEG